MPDTEPQNSTLHERTVVGVRQVLERALTHVEGLEKVVVSRAAQILHPRIEQRIRGASEEDLLVELKYLHELLGSILQETPPKKSSKKPKSKRKSSRS